MFNETRFPFSFVHSSVLASNTPSPDTWLSNLLYLHCSNQSSILGLYSSHTSPPTTLSHTSFLLPQTVTSTISTPSAPIPSPALTGLVTHPISSAPLHTFISISHTTPPDPTPSSLSDPTPPDPSPHILPISVSSSQFDPTTFVLAPVNTHPMTTRSKNGISKPKLCYKVVVDYTYTEPPSYKIASKFLQWVQAMDEEFPILQRQETWSLFPAILGINLVGCKWVYKMKLHSDGSIARYNTRLVAKGFH